MCIKKTLLLFILSYITSLNAQDQIYWKLKVFANHNEFSKIQELGINTDHGVHKKNIFFINIFSEHEKIILDKHNFNYKVLIKNVNKYYLNNRDEVSNKNNFCLPSYSYPYSTPENFELGQMGGYFTYEEIFWHLENMHSIYPDLISIKTPISDSLTIDGHQIYWFEITSQNENEINEDKPQVLYTALHHAREPGSVSQLIFYMYYLLENYGINEQITSLINQAKMFFIPIVNPDGYLYNELTNPDGGGMWRKNRRVNEDGSFGVDLNRNYPFHWGENDQGSSPNPNSETYRGPSAGSESEIKMVISFCLERNIQLSMNYHSYGNLFIYPWGYMDPSLTPDSNFFFAYGQELTQENNYLFGTPSQTVGYNGNGDANDWMYGEQLEKNKILSVTPEVGKEFWENTDEIIPTCKENLFANIGFASMLFPYVELHNKLPIIANSELDSVTIYTKNIGLQLGNFNLTMESENPYVNILTEEAQTIFLNPLEEDSVIFYIEVSEDTPPGSQITLKIIANNGMYNLLKKISFIYGENNFNIIENGESMEQWESENWGLDYIDFYSLNSSITDSPLGNYLPNENSIIELSEPINLQNLNYARLSFFTKWDIEKGWDYAQLQISSDYGNSWIPVCGIHSIEGNQFQDEGQPIYDGVQNEWIEEHIDLEEYLGEQIILRFQMVSDGAVEGDGFHFDDLRISSTSELNIQESNNKFNIYPNPSNEDIQLKFYNRSTGFLKIIGLQGIIIYEKKIENKDYIKIDVNKFPMGSYIIKFNDFNKKWIKAN